MDDRERKDGAVEKMTGLRPFAERLYLALRAEGIEEGVEVTLAGGRRFYVDVLYGNWTDILPPSINLKDFDQWQEFHGELRTRRLDPAFVYFMHVIELSDGAEAPAFPAQAKAYSDEETVAFLRELEQEHQWSLLIDEVIPDDLALAIEQLGFC